jgi:hypothetical protein
VERAGRDGRGQQKPVRRHFFEVGRLENLRVGFVLETRVWVISIQLYLRKHSIPSSAEFKEICESPTLWIWHLTFWQSEFHPTLN